MDNAGLIALGMLRNRATPVKHKFITFVLERDASAWDYTLGAARLAMLVAGAAAQAVEAGLHATAMKNAVASLADPNRKPANWRVTFRVSSKWYAAGDETGKAVGQRPVPQEDSGVGRSFVTVSKAELAKLGSWQPSGGSVAKYVAKYDKPGTTQEIEEEIYDLTKLKNWTSWGAVPKPERLAIEAQVSAAIDFHDARTAVRYAGDNLEAKTLTRTLEGAALDAAIKPLLLLIPGLLDDLDGSKSVEQLPKVDPVSATDRQKALTSLNLTELPSNTSIRITNSMRLAYDGSVLADVGGPSTDAGSFPLRAGGRVETTYDITVSLDPVKAPSKPSLLAVAVQHGSGVGLNTEFMRWFAEFQEIDYQGNLANAEGFYELGTNGPRPRFVTADWNGVTLKTGFVNQEWLFRWTQLVDWGQDFRKDLAIIMFDRAGVPLRLIRVMNAFPVSWKGPVLSAGDSGSQPIESIELTCESLEVTVIPL